MAGVLLIIPFITFIVFGLVSIFSPAYPSSTIPNIQYYISSINHVFYYMRAHFSDFGLRVVHVNFEII